MALEAAQVPRMSQPDPRSLALGPPSQASSRILALEQQNRAPESTVQEPQGAPPALKETTCRCPELQRENQELREWAEELVAQLKLENDNSQRLAIIKDELEREIRRLCRTIDTLHLIRAAQLEAEEMPCEQLGEQEQQLRDIQEALWQEQEDKALLAQENARLRQEVDRLTSRKELLQEEQEPLRTRNQELQDSVKVVQQNFRICQNMEEQRSTQISLTEMITQCQSVTHFRKDMEEKTGQIRSEIDSLMEENKSLLEEPAGTSTQNTESLKPMPAGKEEEEAIITGPHEAQDPAPRTESLKPMPAGKEEEEAIITGPNEAQDPASRTESLTPITEGKEEEEAVITGPHEAQDPAARTRKFWRRGRFLRFFQRQRDGSRRQAKSPPESAPGSLEATPASSHKLDEGDAHSGPPPKASGPRKSAFRSRKKKDEGKEKPPRARSALSHLLCCCTC